jgi:hypothetical protein
MCIRKETDGSVLWSQLEIKDIWYWLLRICGGHGLSYPNTGIRSSNPAHQYIRELRFSRQWRLEPWSVVVCYQRFGGPCCLHLQSEMLCTYMFLGIYCIILTPLLRNPSFCLNIIQMASMIRKTKTRIGLQVELQSFEILTLRLPTIL